LLFKLLFQNLRKRVKHDQEVKCPRVDPR
jgi:hypothetical protein